MSNILNSIKKMLGIDLSYTAFDNDIIFHINTVIFTLWQLGIGSELISIDVDTEWSDYLGDTNNFEAVKSLVYLKVRMLFDPPSSSIVNDAANRMISEIESRLLYEYGVKENE